MMFSLICVWINGWVNNREAGDLRRYRGHYDVSVMDHTCPEVQQRIIEISILVTRQDPRLPTWINFNPSMDR